MGDIYLINYKVNVGDELSSIIGLLDFSYGSYKIQFWDVVDVVVGVVVFVIEMIIVEVQ